MSKRDLYIKAKSGGWQRPTEWLTLPVHTNINQRVFYGLFLVFEGEQNALRITFGGNPTVDWGDGSASFTLTTPTTKVYDYDAIISPINQYNDGRNYKQVIISVINFNTASFNLNLNETNVITATSALNFADIYMSYGMGSASTGLTFSEFRTLPYLEIFKFENIILTGSVILNRANKLQQIEFNNVNRIRTLSLNRSHIYGKFEPPTIRTWGVNSYNSVFIEELDEVVYSGDDGGDGMFQDFLGKRINKVKVNGVAGFQGRWMFRRAYNLEYVGLIDTPFTSYLEAFNSATNIREVNFLDFSSVTNTTSMFANTGNLRKLITPGCQVGISVQGNMMTKEAIEDWFNSLGTANGTQTLTITNNPGANTADLTIATNKGYNVIN